MPVSAELQTVLAQRRAATDENDGPFESSPVPTQADASALSTPAPEVLSAAKEAAGGCQARLSGEGITCHYCHREFRGFPSVHQYRGRMYCNEICFCMEVNHGRRPFPEDSAPPGHGSPEMRAAEAASLQMCKPRRCSQPMSGTLVPRPAASAQNGAAWAPSRPPLMEKVQATDNQKRIWDLWFGKRSIDVTVIMGDRGPPVCVAARRVASVQEVKERVASQTGRDAGDFRLQVAGSAPPADDAMTMLGSLFPLKDFSVTLVEVRGAGQEAPAATERERVSLDDQCDVRIYADGTLLPITRVQRSWTVLDLKAEIAKITSVAPWEMAISIGQDEHGDALKDGQGLATALVAAGEPPTLRATSLAAQQPPSPVDPGAELAMQIFEVVVDFTPSASEGGEQLPLRVGQRVVVMEQDESGWWGGTLEGDETLGWFPGNCVRLPGSE